MGFSRMLNVRTLRTDSRDASVTFEWADSEYTFRMPIKQLQALEEVCDAGARWLYMRIEAGMEKSKDISEPIRFGLIGGGKTPDEARVLVNRWVYDRPWHENIDPAKAILAVCVAGPEDEPIKKAAGETEPQPASPLSPEESSGSPHSMETAP